MKLVIAVAAAGPCATGAIAVAPLQPACGHDAGAAATVVETPEHHPIHYRRTGPAPTDPGTLTGAEAGAVEMSTRSPDTLLRRFLDLHTAMRYEQAAAVAQELARVAPERPEAHYNHACALARMHRVDDAFAALSEAVDTGWRQTEHLRLDPDLASLRQDQRFDALLERVARLAESERPEARPLRTDPWPEAVADLHAAAGPLLARCHAPALAISYIREGQVVWSGGINTPDAATAVTLDPDRVVRLEAGRELLTLLAALRREAAGDLSIAALILEHRQLAMRTPDDEPASEPGAAPVRTRTTSSGRPVRERGSTAGATPAPRVREMNGSAIGLIAAALEVVTREPLEDHLRHAIVEPLEMNATYLDFAEAPAGRLAVGHSRLGTPLPLADAARIDDSEAAAVYTTAGDLGRLLGALANACGPPAALAPASLAPDDPAPVNPVALHAPDVQGLRAIERLWSYEEALPGGTGLSVQFEQTTYGRRMEFVEVNRGMGTLVRWYPEARSGIVIVFNAETAVDAARRLAHVALGGSP